VITITPATYQLSANPTTLNIAQGGTGSTTITVAPTGAYNGTVALSCVGLPANSTCAFAPASVTFNGTPGAASQTIALTIATNVSTTALLRPHNSGYGTGDRRILFASFFLLPGALLMNLGRRKRLVRLITLILVGGVFLSFSGCSSSTPSQQAKGPVTPAGTSKVTVSSSASASVAPLNLTVNISQ